MDAVYLYIWEIVQLMSTKLFALLNLLKNSHIVSTALCIFNGVELIDLVPLMWCFFLLSTISSFLFYLFLGLRGFLYVNLIGIIPFWLLCSYFFSWFVIDGNSFIWECGNLNFISTIDKISFKICFNKLSFSFGYLTLTIGLFVLMYSLFYFRGEPTAERLPFLLMLFVNSMLLLIFSDNLIVTFIGWEMIGVTSFFLINYWNSRLDTLKSAKKALVFNLLSDSLVLITLLKLNRMTDQLDITVLNIKISENLDYYTFLGLINVSEVSLVSLILALGCSIKSAQFIFHAWLPDSMEAPAPASALIHSATLVSAGIYLLAKLTPVWYNEFMPLIPSYHIKDFLILWGATTAAYGGIVSACQTDLKKILAYSTVSHCGYMMILVGCGDLDSLIFYFYIHGMYKALLFLVTGNIMRFYQTQDFRKMGNLWYNLHFECAVCITGFAQLSGAPFSLGFVAKHNILNLIPCDTLHNKLVFTLIVIGACSSLFYSFEFIRSVWFDSNKSSKSIAKLYRDDRLFSKYNNPTGNIGLLVLTSYFTFSCLFGLYLEATLINNVKLSISIDYTNFTQPIKVNNSGPIYGYQQYLLSIITVYSVMTTSIIYILSIHLEERISGESWSWVFWFLFISTTFVAVYSLLNNPIYTMIDLIVNLLKSILNFTQVHIILDLIRFYIINFYDIIISYIPLVNSENIICKESVALGLSEATFLEFIIGSLFGDSLDLLPIFI